MPNHVRLARGVKPAGGRSCGRVARPWLAMVGLATLMLLTVSVIAILPALAADVDDSVDSMFLPQYREILAQYDAKGYKPVEGIAPIVIPAASYSASGNSVATEKIELSTVTSIGGRKGKFLKWNEFGWVEWKFTVPTAGLYEIALDYYPIKGKRSSIQRMIFIDGKEPWRESKIDLKRAWVNETNKFAKDNQDNDVRPRQIESPLWLNFVLRDQQRTYEDPFRFYFTPGVHTLRLQSTREPVVIGNIVVRAPEVIPSYAEVAKTYAAKGYKEVKGVSLKIQSETSWIKSDPAIRPEYGGDALNEPAAHGHMVLNEFGSWNFREGGQWATWKIKVPKTGLYQLGFRVWQGWDQKPSIRNITIDGKVPFKEVDEFFFPYDNRKHQLVIPSDKNGKPYLFYLTKGEHVLGNEVRVGPLRDTIFALEWIARDMSRLARKIVLVTGSDPDPNGEWELDKTVPGLIDGLKKITKTLDEQVVLLTKVCGKRPVAANSLAMISDQLNDMIEDPDSIPGRFDQFSTSQASMGNWIDALRRMPIVYEWAWLASPDAEKPRVAATGWEKFSSTMSSFMISFRKDYTGIGNAYDVKDKKAKVIDVWIGRGREWAEIIKNMAEDDFTPQTGIRVNMNILPVGDTQVMLLSSISGRAPDVALGVPSNIPVDFAIRGALEKLNQFPDYKEVAKRFRPGALIPFRYRGGDWALPEDQDFYMLYYRTDVMQSLGISEDQIPDTWEDVYKLLPVLQQSGLQFYFPPGLFTPFLFQRGGNYYTNDGLASALDTPAALEAFKEWTDLYTKYKIQKQADFFNRMRTGEMPIGVDGYGFYLRLATAAPELYGWWKMKPMPGRRLEDGTIDRSIGGGCNVATIFKNPRSKANPERVKWSWEFIKWWTSTEAQTRFGSELEALLGSGARWNTANVEALMGLPWPIDHKRAIEEQWKWFKENPYVVGGYFSTRHIDNAWNRTVLEQGMNPREALELAVRDINKELERKQEEFGIKPKTSEGKK